MAANVWPAEVPSLQGDLPRAVRRLRRGRALRILEAIARYLDLEPDYFDDTVARRQFGPAPAPLSADPGDGPNVRAGAHEDINTITLLLGAEEAGLQLLDRDGDWLPVTPKAGELVVNIGDMLQRLTNNDAALDHPPRGQPAARAARPFTLLDALLPPFPSRFPDRDPARLHLGGPARTSSRSRSPRDDYLLERLREIKLV